MAAYNSNSGGSHNDMYSDAEPESKPPAGEHEQHEDGETALIPKSLCPDMKPGDEVVLKIVRGTEDDWEVSYAPKKEEAEEPQAPPTDNAPSGDSSMASMME